MAYAEQVPSLNFANTITMHDTLASQTPPPHSADRFSALSTQGLNLHAVLDLAALPADLQLLQPGDADQGYNRLWLVGHQGPWFWRQLRTVGLQGEHPVDKHTTRLVQAWLAQTLPQAPWRLVYPSPQPADLQKLGVLAGWHQPSPFMVGVDGQWGSWFAYRAAVLLRADWTPTPRREQAAPCLSCSHRMCVQQCPAQALGERYDLEACLDHRLAARSSCADRCLARNACPVGAEFRYDDDQTAYHYSRSLNFIRQWRASAVASLSQQPPGAPQRQAPAQGQPG